MTSQPIPSARVHFSLGTAYRSFLLANLRSYSYSVAAVGNTLARMGVYRVEDNGDLTLLSACVSDVTLWDATFTEYTRALESPVPISYGQRIAYATLRIGGGADPNVMGRLTDSGQAALPPRITTQNSPVADLPATLTVANQFSQGFAPLVIGLP